MSPNRQKKITLRLATYNVHKCRGLDGRVDVDRIAAALKPLKADIIALQEVVGPSLRSSGQDEYLAMRLGMTPHLAPARSYRGHLYGNAMLTRLQVVKHVIHDISVPGHEPRLCQRLDFSVEGHVFHVYNVHFGTSEAERARQAKKLIPRIYDEKLRGPKILVGDFNEWKRGRATNLLVEKLKSVDLTPHVGWRRTYPGIIPIFHLDHLYYLGDIEITYLRVCRGLRALIASDHLPILAELRVTLKCP